MKWICKRLAALLLSCAVLTVSVLGRCQPVHAAAIVGPTTSAGVAAGETLKFIYSALMSMGVTLNLKELFGKRYDPDNWDWGDVLDDPATQGQIDDLDKKIGEWYDNAVKDWYVNHGGQITPSPEPTKTPDGSLPTPVTPAPTGIPPDIGEKIDSWRELKEKALQKKVLTMTAVAGACLKEAVTNWWDNIMDTETELPTGEKNKYSYSDCIGYYEIQAVNRLTPTSVYKVKEWAYVLPDNPIPYLKATKTTSDSGTIHIFLKPSDEVKIGTYTEYRVEDSKNPDSPYISKYSSTEDTGIGGFPNAKDWLDIRESYHLYVPVRSGTQTIEPETKPLAKPVLLVNPNLKKALDENKKSPDLPMPISITLPNLDEIKDLVGNADKADDKDKPTIVQTFINNHTYIEPEPTQTPKPDPDSTGSPSTKPDSSGSPSTKPSVTPAVPGDGNVKPKPTTAPGTDTGGGGTGTDPDAPDSSDVNVDDYKTDLRLVFPFCIPFDLIHLLETLDAEPEAPRFEIPVDIEVDDPFPRGRSSGKMIDYETTMVVDMADYEEPIKVIRLFEIIFFIIGLMMITRQHMIKG